MTSGAEVQVFDPATGTMPFRPAEAVPPVLAIALSADGGTAVTVEGDPAVRVRDAATGAPTATLVCGGGTVDAALSPDGKTLAVGVADTVLIWRRRAD